MITPITLLTGLAALALSIYVLLEFINALSSRCCYHLQPLMRAESDVGRLLWSGDLASLAVNPKELWRVSLLRAAKEVQSLTKVELVISGDLMKSLSLKSKLSLIAQLTNRLGLSKGLRVYSLFRRLMKSYPNTLSEALIISEQVSQLILVLRDARD